MSDDLTARMRSIAASKATDMIAALGAQAELFAWETLTKAEAAGDSYEIALASEVCRLLDERRAWR